MTNRLAAFLSSRTVMNDDNDKGGLTFEFLLVTGILAIGAGIVLAAYRTQITNLANNAFNVLGG